jgi:diadenosine tetraphosphate (Ap4A) HIT family hydrolase
MPRARWDALVRGDTCPHCVSAVADARLTALGYTVAELRISRLVLNRNQGVPGWCHVVTRTHVVEPYHLPYAERHRYWDDVMDACRALEAVFGPDKMNIEMHGNGGPHLHCHLKPRFYGDRMGGRPIHPGEDPHYLSESAYDERVRQIRTALRAVRQEQE